MLTIESRMVSIILASGTISFEHMCLWCQVSNPHLITCHSNIGVHIIGVLDLDTSTLYERTILKNNDIIIIVTTCKII